MSSKFHLAIPTHDIPLAKEFYNVSMGAKIGREYPGYVIFDFFGHQLVAHHDANYKLEEVKMYPRHFGIIFETKVELLSAHKKAKKHNLNFFEDIFERFQNKPGWHHSFFLIDPSNNLIEFKWYENNSEV